MIIYDWMVGGVAFSPHGFCLGWNSGLLGLMVISNVMIGISYILIPIRLFSMWRMSHGRGIVFRPREVMVLLLFCGFIFMCGQGHFIKILTIWFPIYRFDAWWDLMTGIVSALTVVVLEFGFREIGPET